MEEVLREVVTQLGNGREVLRMVSKLSDGNEVIECSDGSKLVMHSGGEEYAEWISGPNQFGQQLSALYDIAVDVLQMAAVLSNRSMNDDVSKKIRDGIPYIVQCHDKLREAVDLAKKNLTKARGAMYVMTGITTEVDGAPEEPGE